MSTPIPTICPRCGSGIDGEPYYGICPGCRDELRTHYSGEGRDVTATEYEPKMNVTPNAVASKD